MHPGITPSGRAHPSVARHGDAGLINRARAAAAHVDNAISVAERARLEQELRDLGGRLINAHEQERLRISRELHDNVAQRVGWLSAELGTLRRRLIGATPEIQNHLARLATETAAIGSELHRVSHELHPARLKQLGLEASIRSFCAELTEARDLTVDMTIPDVPCGLGPDAALCLYRITQEALHNVLKHSGADRATVTLTREGSEVVLRVVDGGVGFDSRAVRQKSTLGLVSMRERARLVHARLLVSSRPGNGTTVELRVPLAR